MLATTGYLVNGAGIHFPGMLSHDISFESLSTMNPFDAWEAVPDVSEENNIATFVLCRHIWNNLYSYIKLFFYHLSIQVGKAQIIGTILIAEIATESQDVHYTKGGPLPEIVFPKFDFSKVDKATLERKRNSELNNGRLAMIAIMSFIAANNIPGSVPALVGNPAF